MPAWKSHITQWGTSSGPGKYSTLGLVLPRPWYDDAPCWEMCDFCMGMGSCYSAQYNEHALHSPAPASRNFILSKLSNFLSNLCYLELSYWYRINYIDKNANFGQSCTMIEWVESEVTTTLMLVLQWYLLYVTHLMLLGHTQNRESKCTEQPQ